MKFKALLKEDYKRHRGSLLGIAVLMLLSSFMLVCILTSFFNSDKYIESEVNRVGYGTITAWAYGVPDSALLGTEIESLPDVDRVTVQKILFSSYEANSSESDSEGQLIAFSGNNNFRFLSDDMNGYKAAPEKITDGDIYVSPSMRSVLGVGIGDTIDFPIARNGKTRTFTIKGYYENPYMGSSMIGMKGFLISQSDFEKIQSMIDTSGIDALARSGEMYHIFQSEASDLTVSELNEKINTQTMLTKYSESVHSASAIKGFMLVLQNAFSGLFAAFALLLLVIVMIVISHSIANTLEADYVNLGILKAVGLSSWDIRKIQLFQYLSVSIAGLTFGILGAIPASNLLGKLTITTTGVLISSSVPILPVLIFIAFVILLLSVFVMIKTAKIKQLSPMKAIRGEAGDNSVHQSNSVSVCGKQLSLRLAARQLTSHKKRYISTCVIAVLLCFFACVVGRMDSWLGVDGKGMMDAFNPADHDIGVQMFGNSTIEEAEQIVKKYSNITDSYLLAMPGVSVNGTSYTANVITEPERFHILSGKTCNIDNEVVLTEFVAQSFGVQAGDTVVVKGNNGSAEYIVSGIYSCANDMGDNIGMSREGYLKIGQDNPQLWCYHYFLTDSSQKSVITEALEQTYGGDIHVHENTWPGLFGIISAMRLLMYFMYAVVLAFILIVTIMNVSRLLLFEQRDIGIYKAIGLTDNSLRLSFAFRFGITALLGSIMGVALSAVLTDPLVSAVMKLVGISNFASSFSWQSTALPIAVITLLFFGFGYLTSAKIKHTDLTALITE